MTKNQKLRAAMREDKVRYLHVSVQVGRANSFIDDNGLLQEGFPMRTPKGKGATARKNPEVESVIGRARRARAAK